MERLMIKSKDDDEDSFDAFVSQVAQERPDQTFSFEKDRLGSHQAHWTFPGAICGGSVMWMYGTRELCWGIDFRDIEAWEQYERSCGREPRFT
jgi:hypothetical protein